LAQPTRVEGAYRHVEAVQAEGIAVGVGQVLVVGLCVGMGAVAWASQGGAGSPGIGVEPFEHAEEDAAKAGLDRPIQVDRMPPPSYPKSAFEQRQVGVVNLRVEVDAQGIPPMSGAQRHQSGRVRCGVDRCGAQLDLSAGDEERQAGGRCRAIPITYAMDNTEDTNEVRR
jgi:hypothetical protein